MMPKTIGFTTKKIEIENIHSRGLYIFIQMDTLLVQFINFLIKCMLYFKKAVTRVESNENKESIHVHRKKRFEQKKKRLEHKNVKFQKKNLKHNY